MSNAKQEPPVHSAGLLRDVQAMCMLFERGILSGRQCRDILRTAYPWLPITELPDDFPIPVSEGEPSMDYEPIALDDMEDAA